MCEIALHCWKRGNLCSVLLQLYDFGGCSLRCWILLLDREAFLLFALPSMINGLDIILETPLSMVQHYLTPQTTSSKIKIQLHHLLFKTGPNKNLDIATFMKVWFVPELLFWPVLIQYCMHKEWVSWKEERRKHSMRKCICDKIWKMSFLWQKAMSEFYVLPRLRRSFLSWEVQNQ